LSEKVVSAKELKKCNVLEIDCEGAEVDILKELDIKPRVIIVETHPSKGASTKKVSKIMRNRGYRVKVEGEDPSEGHILVAEQ